MARAQSAQLGGARGSCTLRASAHISPCASLRVPLRCRHPHQALAFVYDPELVKSLFEQVPTRYGERNGGYCRVAPEVQRRRGDNAGARWAGGRAGARGDVGRWWAAQHKPARALDAHTSPHPLQTLTSLLVVLQRWPPSSWSESLLWPLRRLCVRWLAAWTRHPTPSHLPQQPPAPLGTTTCPSLLSVTVPPRPPYMLLVLIEQRARGHALGTTARRLDLPSARPRPATAIAFALARALTSLVRPITPTRLPCAGAHDGEHRAGRVCSAAGPGAPRCSRGTARD